jgi:hypothetical protein
MKTNIDTKGDLMKRYDTERLGRAALNWWATGDFEDIQECEGADPTELMKVIVRTNFEKLVGRYIVFRALLPLMIWTVALLVMVIALIHFGGL